MALSNEQKPVRYDYANQAWIVDGRYERCGHPDAMDCRCYGKLHDGQPVAAQLIHCDHCGLGKESVLELARDVAALYPEIDEYEAQAFCCETVVANA